MFDVRYSGAMQLLLRSFLCVQKIKIKNEKTAQISYTTYLMDLSNGIKYETFFLQNKTSLMREREKAPQREACLDPFQVDSSEKL